MFDVCIAVLRLICMEQGWNCCDSNWYFTFCLLGIMMAHRMNMNDAYARSCNGWSLRSGACSCSPSFMEGDFIHNKFYFINTILSVTQENTVGVQSVDRVP